MAWEALLLSGRLVEVIIVIVAAVFILTKNILFPYIVPQRLCCCLLLIQLALLHACCTAAGSSVNIYCTLLRLNLLTTVILSTAIIHCRIFIIYYDYYLNLHYLKFRLNIGIHY